MSAWPIVKLGQVAEFINGDRGKNYPSEGDFADTGIPFINAGHLTSGEVDFSEMNYINESRFNLLGSGKTRENDILYCLRGSLGKTAIVRQKGNAAIASSLVIIRPSNECSVGYLYHFLTSPFGQVEVRKFDNGSSQPNLSANSVKSYLFPLPPLAEQRRIAEVLDRAEALRAKRRAALAQLDTLTQSLFLDLFGDPATNPKGWPKKTLGEVAREKPNNGIFRKNPEYIQDGDGGLPVVWVEELFRGDAIDTKESRRVIPVGPDIEKYGLKTGDILFCRSSLKLDGIAFNNVYLGKDDEALFECHLIRISPDLTIVSPVFLNCLLRLPQMRAIAKSKSKTATMTTIDQQGLCSIELPLPPIKLQDQFSSQVRAMEKLKASHRASLVELDALFATLQNRAFNGEL